MSGGLVWQAAELDRPEKLKAVIAFADDVIGRCDEYHLRHDLSWATACGETDGLTALCLEAGEVSGFCLLVCQEKPLSFQIGELTYYRHPLKRYHLWSEPLIADVDPQSKEWERLALSFVDALYENLCETGAAITLEALSTEGPFHRLLRNHPEVKGKFLMVPQGQAYGHQRINMPATLDDYLAGLGSKSRKSLNYSRRKLHRDFANDVVLQTCMHEEDISSFLDKAVRISKSTYQWHLLGLGLRDRDRLQERMLFAAGRGWLRSYLLECGGRPVAFMLAYQYRDRFHYIDVGYDPDFARWSVGSVLQLLVIEDLYKSAHRPSVFDFATGYGEHKARFANASTEEANWLLLPRSLRNSMLAGTYRRLDGLAHLAVSAANRVGVKQSLKNAVRRLAVVRAP